MSENPYKIAYERERKARMTAEKILDEKTREVYSTLNMIQSQYNNLSKKQRKLEKLNKELKSAQRQLVHSEKMASLGQLSAGIAHEINNPVGFVLSNIESMTDYVESYERIINTFALELGCESDKVEQILKAEDFGYIKNDLPLLLSESIVGLQRVCEIVINLKSFSRISESKRKLEDINGLLENTVKVTWNELKHHVKICFNLAEIPPILCNSGQLSQVFVNLLVNAGHALKNVNRGAVIEIATIPAEDHIIIKVKDNGVGMPEKVRDRIFDPFYTTKPVGVGTGLGLSVSHGIIERHQGTINVESAQGVGTTFIIKLPIDPEKTSLLPEIPEMFDGIDH